MFAVQLIPRRAAPAAANTAEMPVIFTNPFISSSFLFLIENKSRNIQESFIVYAVAGEYQAAASL